MRAVFLLLVLVAGCAPAREACSPATLTAIEADYLAAVLAQCEGYTLDTCPATPALQARRFEVERKAGCEP
jgi:hypothetical protein